MWVGLQECGVAGSVSGSVDVSTGGPATLSSGRLSGPFLPCVPCGVCLSRRRDSVSYVARPRTRSSDRSPTRIGKEKVVPGFLRGHLSSDGKGTEVGVRGGRNEGLLVQVSKRVKMSVPILSKRGFHGPRSSRRTTDWEDETQPVTTGDDTVDD